MRLREACATAAALVALSLFAGGCGEAAGTDPTVVAVPAPERLAGGSKVARCPHDVDLTPGKGPACTLVNEVIELKRCPAIAGSDVRARGIPCREASRLVVPLGNPGDGFRAGETLVYDVWKASGSYLDPRPELPTGWTCWAGGPGYDRISTERVCWRGDDVLVFGFTP